MRNAWGFNIQTLKKLGLIALNIIVPQTCLYCKKDQRYDYKFPLCENCLKELEPIKFPYCQKCGIELKSGGALCYNCKKDKVKRYFSFSRSVFKFNPVLREAIHTFKYSGYKNIGRWLGSLMAEKFIEYKELEGFDFLIPVPISLRKKRERGFNQSEILAFEISKKTGLSVLSDVVVKIKDTKSQVGLSQNERENNLEGSFSCINHDKIKGKKIIIVDDVATTLSTLNEVSKVLKKSGVKEIACYTLARE